LQAELIENDFTVGVSFRHSAKPEDYRCNHLPLQVGDTCVVDTEHGPSIGKVSRGRMKAVGRKCCHRLRNVIRKATSEDLEKEKRILEKEAEIYRFGRKKIDEFELKMRLGHLEVTYDEKRVILYFTADNRVDFRDMVKAIASELDLKVEMRQVGIRDEAKKLGGCGICGEGLCCTSFLDDFAPVSIRMAKDQGLSLNPAKISGVCGRLMCCLNYENDFYREMQKIVPKPGKAVKTPQGRGRVISSDYFKKQVVVDFGGEIERMTFNADEVSLFFPPQQKGSGKKNKQRGGGQHGRPEMAEPETDADTETDDNDFPDEDSPVDKK